ncbi:MAG: hypothetical protein ABIW79_07075 [Gemmatimonas sp.]
MTERSREAEGQSGSEDLRSPVDWFVADAVIERDAVQPLEPWLSSLVKDAMHIDDSSVPRDLMWARIRQQRREGLATTAERETAKLEAATLDVATHKGARHGFRVTRTIMSRVLAVAATLAIGVAIGRYGTPVPSQGAGATVANPVGSAGASTTAAVDGAAARALHAGEPAVVAMEEHLARTVALLVAVRNESPDAGPGADVSGWARELLGTTRLLLDEPQLREYRTRRLLQDLELVLVQIIQARGTAAPEARRAPSETMRETNLLPRVRAAATASITTGEPPFRGIAE